MRGRTMEHLDREACVKLMEGHPAGVGRIALAGPRPVIFPVNYAIDRGNIVFRTDPDTKFRAAVHKAFVAFEGDWVEPTWQTGWSVVVWGQAHVVTGSRGAPARSRLPLLPWAESDKGNFDPSTSGATAKRRIR